MNGMQYFDINDNTAAVRAFQEMLRLVFAAEENFPPIAVDGVYGDGMREAVLLYQKSRKLPQTGNADAVTQKSVSDEYETILKATSPPIRITPFPHIYGFTVQKGEKSDLVLLIQLMLSSLRLAYDEFDDIPLNGIYDTKTSEAIRSFQLRNLLPERDLIDLETWNTLARQYNYYVNNAQ